MKPQLRIWNCGGIRVWVCVTRDGGLPLGLVRDVTLDEIIRRWNATA